METNIKKYKFGWAAKEVANDDNGFVVSECNNNHNEDYNPYGDKFFKNPENVVTNGGEHVASIPSPYARMHVTDIAFREYCNSKGFYLPASARANSESVEICDDFRKSISHCLDLFEIMYHLTDFELNDLGISISYNEVVTPTTTGFEESLDKNVKDYIRTLQLYRDCYNNVIVDRKINNGNVPFYYDFTVNYLFKYNGNAFASTSPFTGFYTKAYCNLVHEVNGQILPIISIGGRGFLTNKKNDWKLFDRDPRFLEFLYLLLRSSGLSHIYKHLFTAVKYSVNYDELERKNFETEFPAFNIGQGADKLPKLRDKDIYVRPTALDRSYLKYVLFLDRPFDFNAEIEESNIDKRKSPNSDELMKWLSTTDILADSLVILPYDVSDKYKALKYVDVKTKQVHNRCLIPIKSEALKYFKIDDLINLIEINQYDSQHYCVKLKLPLANGGDMELRRDYYAPTKNLNYNEEKLNYPNGVVIMGPQMKQFVFGIYPFAKSKDFENIYKVLFYNDIDEYKWGLNFFYEDKEGEDSKLYKYDNDNVKYNKTNIIDRNDTFYPHNCTYYEVRGNERDSAPKKYIKLAELGMTVDVPINNNQFRTFSASSLIIPELKNVKVEDGAKGKETVVAVDLGTSNTYMAYSHDGDDPVNFTTRHSDYYELEFMHKAVSQNVASHYNAYCHDAVLPSGNNEVSTESLSAQLSEFIPACIDESGFAFPIPSVINRLKHKDGVDEMIPLLNRSIPFAYYKEGYRRNGDKNIDDVHDGDFKWFYEYKNGGYATNPEKKSDFEAFMAELLFIIRCHMLCNGYDLKNCKLIWTYPLSFRPAHVKQYDDAWVKNYAKMFHPECVTCNSDQIDEKVKNYIKHTNESLTPFFECCNTQNQVHHLNLLIDIGGGSTDVIGYKNNSPVFITSFAFAGNSLYLEGNLNNENLDRGSHYLNKAVTNIRNEVNANAEKDSIQTIKTICSDDKVKFKSFMNYGFSHRYNRFEEIFNDDAPLFMLQLHNAALFYHIAQVCHAFMPDEIPVQIFLTGNGSKLIDLSANRLAKSFLETAFKVVYQKDDPKIKITLNGNPKATTTYGALKGNKNNHLSFNEDALDKRVIALGGENMFYRLDKVHDVNGYSKTHIRDHEEAVNKVFDNVAKFVELFYASFYPYGVGKTHIGVEKEEMIELLDSLKGHQKITFDGEDYITDSLFFQVVSLLMEDVSAKLVEMQSR